MALRGGNKWGYPFFFLNEDFVGKAIHTQIERLIRHKQKLLPLEVQELRFSYF